MDKNYYTVRLEQISRELLALSNTLDNIIEELELEEEEEE